MYKTNVLSPIMINRHAIRNMLYNRVKGSFVSISSISSSTGYKGLSMYASTKGALESLTKNLAREWGPRQIRFNCVVPGFMETDMSKTLTKEHPKVSKSLYDVIEGTNFSNPPISSILLS